MQTNLKHLGFKFDWLDIYDPSEEELRKAAETYQLPEAAVIDCLQSEHLPKFETFENYQFIIVRFYDQHCSANSDSIQKLTRKIAIFFNNDFILTIHRSKFDLLDKVAQKYSKDANMKHPYSLACKIVKNTFETFELPLNNLDETVSNYESKIFLKKRTPDLLQNLYLLKRQIHVYKRLNYVSKMVVDHLQSHHKKNSYYEDLHDYFLRLEVLTEQLHEDVQSLLHLYLSISSQKTNEVMRILTVFSAFFLPLTFIVGVYGMNFNYMPELRHHYGYPGILIFMLLITLLIFQWFKRKKWL
jgi:magnesium transporter